MPGSSTKPRSVIYYNQQLSTGVRHVRGHQAYCACGWTGHIWKDLHTAQLERSFHVCVSEPES
jgi:hypothetical protein